jgi:hypothetical protein
LAGNANGQSKPAGWLARLGMAASIALAIWFLPEFWVWAWPYRYGAKDAVWFMRALLLVGLRPDGEIATVKWASFLALDTS